MKLNLRYLPKKLTRKDRLLQGKEILKSRKLYKKKFIIQDQRFLHLNQKNLTLL